MWQYGFILGLWLSQAIISIPWGYIVSEPLLALRSGVEDLIYLSQGLRDHPARVLYRIILGSLVLLLKGRRKTRCNMQLHTCQTVPGLVIPEEWSAEGNAFKCFFVSWLTWQKKIWDFVSRHPGCNLQNSVLQHSEVQSICLKEAVSLRTRMVWSLDGFSQFEMLLKRCWSMNLGLTASPTFWHDEIASFKQKTVELPHSVVSQLVEKKNKVSSDQTFVIQNQFF